MRRLAALLTLAMSGIMTAPAAAQMNWSQRLGFPPEKRVVILHANGVGLAYELNRPAQQGLKDGVLNSISAISAGPWCPEAASWVQEHPGFDVGVALSFVNPSP